MRSLEKIKYRQGNALEKMSQEFEQENRAKQLLEDVRCAREKSRRLEEKNKVLEKAMRA